MHPAFVILDIAGGYPDEGQAGGTFHGVIKYHAEGAEGKNSSVLRQRNMGIFVFLMVFEIPIFYGFGEILQNLNKNTGGIIDSEI
mgnify:CR=1 FL=1